MLTSIFSIFSSSCAYENMNAKEFENAINNDKNAIVLDVRTQQEYRSGHIKGSKNIDVTSSAFDNQIKTLDKSKNYYVYCRSGGRSRTACSSLCNNGFEKVVNLSGGIMSWHGKLE